MSRLNLLGLCTVFLLVLIIPLSLSANVITFEANILSNATEEAILSLEVPDYIFLGNVTIGEKSSETTISINNTGNVDLLITPELVNSGEDIFSYLYFRSQKTQTINGTSGIPVPFEKIGLFSFSVSKPASGSSVRKKDFYTVLDLTNYTGPLQDNLIGHRADVKLVAVAA